MPYQDPFTPIQRQVWDQLLRVTDGGRVDFVGRFTVPGLTGADIISPLNSFVARGFISKVNSDPANQKAGRVIRVLTPGAGTLIEVGEIRLTPQQRRVTEALLALTENGTAPWEGILKIAGVPTATVAGALAAMRELGVLEVETLSGPLGYIGRRIRFLVDPERVLVSPKETSAGEDDAEDLEDSAPEIDPGAFARAGAKAFPGGADYRVGIYPPAARGPVPSHPDIIPSTEGGSIHARA